ncbi:sugar MFS transporter [uncultured Psychroserpens sp.]|uniref:sugar MFS transporter n=1 Tax=uncultured Psychroserpens sp. TaxID=255436 RepID=UPI00261FF945|nr:sugar MFS transporter [uncultured Psychroserpens sp.]
MNQQKSYRSSFILLTTLFFLWGFITVLVDSLVPRLRELFTLSYAQAIMVQFAFFGAYLVLSVPASYILSKIGYKKGIILGLLTLAFGCLLFYPAASYRVFGIFIIAYFIVAGAITILQVAANPYVTVLGSEAGASSRLNLSQAFNSLGTAIAPAVGALYILSDSVKSEIEIANLTGKAKELYLASEASAIQKPFLGLAVFIVLIAVIFLFSKLPKVINEKSEGTYAQVFKQKNLMLGVLGIFFYVGAEVSIGSFLVNYFQDMNMYSMIKESPILITIAEFVAKVFQRSLEGSDEKALLGIFVMFYWTGAMVGRFFGSYLTKIMKPGKVLGIFATLAISLILLSVSTVGLISMWSILAVGLFNSIMFPTIFALAIEGTGELKPKGSGLLCMAIFGGAIISKICGELIDFAGFKIAFIAITLCYAYILWFGYKNSKTIIIQHEA